jgi:hypothetical protein
MSTDTEVLTSQHVETVFAACLTKDGENTSDYIIAEGIIHTVGFHRDRIEEYRQEIHDMLAELPDEFKASGGGGYSFLNACLDRYGNQWTGLHQTQEQLVLLGIAIGEVAYCLPREMWSVFPGGVPYFVITQGVVTKDHQANSVRDALIASSPQHEGLIRTRDQVVEKWCKDHAIAKDELSIEQILAIRSLPEWKNAS